MPVFIYNYFRRCYTSAEIINLDIREIIFLLLQSFPAICNRKIVSGKEEEAMKCIRACVHACICDEMMKERFTKFCLAIWRKNLKKLLG